jgi:Flp pilus assembly protein TadG
MVQVPHTLYARTNTTRHRDERGSTTLEFVVIGPALLLILGLLIVAGRVMLAGNAVGQAADEAARSASIARTAAQARSQAQSAATASLARQGLQCSSTEVSIDVAGFSVPVGQPAKVTATITCQVKLGDISIPGLPGSRTETATSVSPLDTYRARS